MQRIFSGWHLGERAWVVAPLAIWIAAYLLFALGTMIVRRRPVSVRGFVRELGTVWKVTFAAAVIWLVGWSIWLTVEGGAA